MKQTVVPTKWEAVFHLYLWGAMVTLGIIAFLDFIGLLLVTLALHLTTFGEDQIAGYMPLLVFGCWALGGAMGHWLHKRHLTRSHYDFSSKKIRLACIAAQCYGTFLYFVTIAVF